MAYNPLKLTAEDIDWEEDEVELFFAHNQRASADFMGTMREFNSYLGSEVRRILISEIRRDKYMVSMYLKGPGLPGLGNRHETIRYKVEVYKGTIDKMLSRSGMKKWLVEVL